MIELKNLGDRVRLDLGGGRRWRRVAVTFDARTGEVPRSLDGSPIDRVRSERHRTGRTVTFGSCESCEIGNRGLPLAGVPFPVRNLNGRVDEFLLYRTPLSADEIAALHALGAPDR